jgi:hypothetical protein
MTVCCSLLQQIAAINDTSAKFALIYRKFVDRICAGLL